MGTRWTETDLGPDGGNGIGTTAGRRRMGLAVGRGRFVE